MIKKITMERVASYKESTELITDKSINLIYGLNGSGKSTFSNYLYNSSNDLYKYCHIDSDGESNILVYNQQFIIDNFYEDSLKGIFTLSKENKESKKKIDELVVKINDLKKEKENLNKSNDEITTNLELLESNYQNLIWNIKKRYDSKKFLDYCFEKIKKDKKTFFEHFLNVVDNGTEEKEISSIEEKIKELNTSSEILPNILKFENKIEGIEKDLLFKKAIVGSKESNLSEIIDKLNSSDWVKKGIGYLDLKTEKIQKCPFCQKETIDKDLINELKKAFDASYEERIKTIDLYYNTYENYYNELHDIELENLPIDNNIVIELSGLMNDYKNTLANNLNKIKEKKNMPSLIVKLESSEEMLNQINSLINSINIRINDLNQRLINKQESLQRLKEDFWTLLKRENDSTIDTFLSELKKQKLNMKDNNNRIENIDNEIRLYQKLIIEEQKKTINIDEAIDNINNNLIEIGITDFYITKASDKMYKIIRNTDDNNIFKSLSEGEKMIISFLYFVELCNGAGNLSSNVEDKVVVLDDPINSMSHIYIFNIGRLIKKMFFDNFSQVFVLTHSLYFFYELAYIKKEDRDEKQKLFRIIKNEQGSKFENMHYKEIQNDYQAYWSVIKDRNSNPALIANCMRNIVEYFFGFIEKESLNNIFQKDEFKDNKFQAFNRYINRESHSFGENIFDMKEFDYEVFFEGFKLIFELSGYNKHYLSMMK